MENAKLLAPLEAGEFFTEADVASMSMVGSGDRPDSSRQPFPFRYQPGGQSAIGFAAVGIFFGYYPTKRAASAKPIEALRFE